MEDPNKDLKQEEEETSKGNDQPENNSTEPDDDDQEDLKKENLEKKSSDDEVTISKSELEQLRKDAAERDNLSKAVIRLNRLRGRSLPGSEPEKKTEPDKDEYDDHPNLENYVTKQELLKRDEKSVISKACENPEIDENWDDILVYYVPPRDNDYESKLEAIYKAHRLWSVEKKLENPPKPESKEKQVTQELTSDKGLNKGKEKNTTPPKKSIMPKKQKMEDWY